MTSPDGVPRSLVRGARLLTGLSRAQERRLRSLWLEEWGLCVVARCGSAAQLLDVMQRGEGDVVLVDEDLHRFDSGHRAALWQAGTPLVALVREPQDLRWRDVPGLLLPLDAEMPAVLDALERAAHGERLSRMHKPSSGAQDATTPTVAGVAQPTRLQILALWAGRGHAGSTLLATSTAAILGSAAATVLVDLDTTGAAVGVHLDDGHQGRVRSSLADLINADLDSNEAWQRELTRALQPLGPFAPHGQVLCGLPRGRQRSKVSGAFVERLIAELRSRFTFVVLDVGPESPDESQVTAAGLRAADQVLVVATPDPPGLHRARVAVHAAAAILDRSRAALVLNRYDPRVHTDLRKVDSEIGLPIVSLVPEDTRTVQRALLAGQPAVCEPSSRIRAPLLDLMDRLAAGQVAWPRRDPWAAPPLWARVRASMAASPLSLLGGSGR
jgi:MinD-like ATPase involved in chromosome partitioning or flagellar assembly